jgi:hypothetical protein
LLDIRSNRPNIYYVSQNLHRTRSGRLSCRVELVSSWGVGSTLSLCEMELRVPGP